MRVENPLNELWTELYRPRVLSAVGLDPEIRTQLQGYITAQQIPHLLFAGPPGCGKTTVAKILLDHLPCSVLTLNASSERGIDVIRGKVKNFCTSLMGAEWNYVFFDEADQLTPDAQASLRNTMETYSDRSRFILTANNVSKIIDAIQSRCTPISLGGIPWEERFRILRSVLDYEGIDYDPQVALTYANAYQDMRRVLNSAQSCIRRKGKLEPHGGESSIDGGGLVALIERAHMLGLPAVRKHLLAISRDGTIDHVLLVRSAIFSVPSDFDHCITLTSALYSWWKDLQSFETATVFVGGFCEVVESLK